MKYRLHPLGSRIKIKVGNKQEAKTAGGIIYEVADEKREDGEDGVVVELGNLAYANLPEPWVKLGDRVLFQRYGGKPTEEMDSDGSIGYFRTIKDIDVIGLLEEVK